MKHLFFPSFVQPLGVVCCVVCCVGVCRWPFSEFGAGESERASERRVLMLFVVVTRVW